MPCIVAIGTAAIGIAGNRHRDHPSEAAAARFFNGGPLAGFVSLLDWFVWAMIY
jgi:hypothetical protein